MRFLTQFCPLSVVGIIFMRESRIYDFCFSFVWRNHTFIQKMSLIFSAAAFCSPGTRWEYWSKVMLIEECPSLS